MTRQWNVEPAMAAIRSVNNSGKLAPRRQKVG